MFTVILPLPRQMRADELAKKFAKAASMQQYPDERWKRETYVNKAQWCRDSLDPVVVKETLVVFPEILTRRKRYFFCGPTVEKWQDADNLAIKLVLNPQIEYAGKIELTVVSGEVYYRPFVFDDEGIWREVKDPEDPAFATMRPKLEKFLKDLSTLILSEW